MLFLGHESKCKMQSGELALRIAETMLIDRWCACVVHKHALTCKDVRTHIHARTRIRT